MTIRLFLTFVWSFVFVTVRRLARGPLWPGWTWTFECINHYLKQQTRQAGRLPDLPGQRRYTDALVFPSPALKQVHVEPAAGSPVPAAWYAPQNGTTGRVLLYLHGLPPIYVQAGTAEALIDQIHAFVDAAQAQGADLRFDAWDGMSHDFQAYGDDLAQAREALTRLGQVVDHRLLVAERQPAQVP
jgi:acetyl esterase/lipase